MSSKDIPLYRNSYKEASKNGVVHLWGASQNENLRCKQFLDKTISDRYDGQCLPPDIAKNAIELFGYDRVNWVLANTIQLKNNDGRFSQKNKEWASDFYIPRPKGETFCRDYMLGSHPGLIDLAARQAREAYEALDLYGSGHCIPESGKLNYENRVLILQADFLSEEYKSPENQLFLATHGNGCKPNAIGRSVFGLFVSDGEKGRVYRHDVAGIIRDECLPDWAVEKLAELNAEDTQSTVMEQG